MKMLKSSKITPGKKLWCIEITPDEPCLNLEWKLKHQLIHDDKDQSYHKFAIRAQKEKIRFNRSIMTHRRFFESKRKAKKFAKSFVATYPHLFDEFCNIRWYRDYEERLMGDIMKRCKEDIVVTGAYI